MAKSRSAASGEACALRAAGDDPDAILHVDRETLTPRLHVDGNEVPVALSPGELFLTDPGTVAGEALRMRERVGG